METEIITYQVKVTKQRTEKVTMMYTINAPVFVTTRSNSDVTVQQVIINQLTV